MTLSSALRKVGSSELADSRAVGGVLSLCRTSSFSLVMDGLRGSVGGVFLVAAPVVPPLLVAAVFSSSVPVIVGGVVCSS